MFVAHTLLFLFSGCLQLTRDMSISWVIMLIIFMLYALLFIYTKPALYRSVHILMLLNKEYISLQCLVLHDSHQTWFQEYNGKNNKIPQILSSYYKALNRDFSDLIITLHLLGFDDAVLNLYSAYISLLSSYAIFPSFVLETHRDWACLNDHISMAGAVENCFIPLLLSYDVKPPCYIKFLKCALILYHILQEKFIFL